MLRFKVFSLISLVAALTLSGAGRAQPQVGTTPSANNPAQNVSHRAPTLGTDMSFAATTSPLIDGWMDKTAGNEMAVAFRSAGLKSLRFLFGGLYSPRGPEASEVLKAENKLPNKYRWFPLDSYVEFIAAHDFTTIVGINVEEGPAVARDAIQKFIDRGLKSRIVAIELSNEPWLNHRPWLPEDYAARAADVIEGLTPLGVPFALPLTEGRDNNTPTRLSDNEWVTRMLRALTARISLKQRSDVYGVLHLYSRGVRGGTIDSFNRVVKPFVSKMRYLITEFNIRHGLEGNPHLTNQYAMEFARKVADVMSRPEIEAMYTHSVPDHSIVYWSNGRRYATVVGGRDERLTGAAMSRGWHLTPTGKVYELYSRLAWNGDVLAYEQKGDQSYWAVKATDGSVVVTVINDSGKATSKKANIAGRAVTLAAPPRSIVCMDLSGQPLERLLLAY